MLSLVRQYIYEDADVTVFEYGLIVLLVAVVVVPILTTIGARLILSLSKLKTRFLLYNLLD